MPLPSLETVRDQIGREIGLSDWMTVDQRHIDLFAEATQDRYWIHTDPARARRETPFKTTIAHGFLSLSLLVPLHYRSVREPSDDWLGLNYGLDKVRFLAPVKCGDRVRARFVLAAVEERVAGQLMLQFDATVEIEGGDKPALIAAWRNLYIRQDKPRKPELSPAGERAAAARKARQAEALRRNLRRRKAPARESAKDEGNA